MWNYDMLLGLGAELRARGIRGPPSDGMNSLIEARTFLPNQKLTQIFVILTGKGNLPMCARFQAPIPDLPRLALLVSGPQLASVLCASPRGLLYCPCGRKLCSVLRTQRIWVWAESVRGSREYDSLDDGQASSSLRVAST